MGLEKEEVMVGSKRFGSSDDGGGTREEWFW